MAAHAGPDAVESGLVLHLDAGNTKSYPGTGATWTDLSGNGRTGTLTNGPTFNSANNGSISFDGSNDFIQMPARVTLSTGLTFSAWINTTSTKSSKGYVGDASLNIVGDTSNAVWIGFGVTAGKVNYNNAQRNATWKAYTSLASVNTGIWKNISITHATSEEVGIYIDGMLDTTGNNASSGGYDPWSHTGFNRIAIGYSSSDAFSGLISNVQIYNRALSAAEIKQNFNSLRGRYGI